MFWSLNSVFYQIHYILFSFVRWLVARPPHHIHTHNLYASYWFLFIFSLQYMYMYAQTIRIKADILIEWYFLHQLIDFSLNAIQGDYTWCNYYTCSNHFVEKSWKNTVIRILFREEVWSVDEKTPCMKAKKRYKSPSSMYIVAAIKKREWKTIQML